MKIDKFFSEIYYINLDNRPDRKEKALQEFTKIGIKPERSSGVIFNGNYNIPLNLQQLRWVNGVMGCIHAHRIVLEKAKDKDSHVLIFEDDVKFINDSLNVIENALDKLPEDWKMLYLGGNIERGEIIQISEHLGKTSFVKSTHSYAVNKNFISLLLNIVPTNQAIPLDEVYAYQVAPNYSTYITIPMITVQQQSFSDIEGTTVEYESWMEKRFYKNLVRMEETK